jgi:hypothetical protein
MIAVIFEVEPAEGAMERYLDHAARLRPMLMEMDGFISVERFESLTTPGRLLSLSIWRDEAAPGATSVLVEPGGAGAEAVVVVGHPGEVERLEVRREAGGVVIATPIFAGDLEKGVLLRGRVLAATGPAATARSWARDLAVAFADTAPMLST